MRQNLNVDSGQSAEERVNDNRTQNYADSHRYIARIEEFVGETIFNPLGLLFRFPYRVGVPSFLLSIANPELGVALVGYTIMMTVVRAAKRYDSPSNNRAQFTNNVNNVTVEGSSTPTILSALGATNTTQPVVPQGDQNQAEGIRHAGHTIYAQHISLSHIELCGDHNNANIGGQFSGNTGNQVGVGNVQSNSQHHQPRL